MHYIKNYLNIDMPLFFRSLLVLSIFLVSVYKAYGLLFFPTLFSYLLQILFVFVALDIIWHLMRNKYKFTRNYLYTLIILLLLYCWIIFSLSYSPSPEYKYIKAINYLVPLLFFLYAPILNVINFEKIVYPYLLFILPLVLIIFLTKVSFLSIYQSNYLSIMGDEGVFDYLAVGTHLSIIIIILNFYKKLVYLQIAVIALIFIIGARGPLLFLIPILIAMNFRSLFTKQSLIYFIFVLALLTLIIFTSEEESIIGRALNRLLLLFDFENPGESILLRLGLLKFSIFSGEDNISSIFFGAGFGSFGYNFLGLDYRAYPHNIFLEVFYELGLIGLCILSSISIFIYRSVKFKKNVFLWIFFLLFLNSLKSSQLTDHWLLFCYLGLLLNSRVTKYTVDNMNKYTS